MKEIYIGLFVMFLGWICNYLYKKNTLYYRIIREFRGKLSPRQNRWKELSKSDIEKIPNHPKTMEYVTVINVSTHETSVTRSELDVFLNRIEDFDYFSVLFEKYYRERTENILRLKPKPENKNFDLIILQKVLKDDPIHPLEFRKIFIHHIKWEWKLTSYFYTWKIRRKKRKMLQRTK
jgi:hypothetical protein